MEKFMQRENAYVELGNSSRTPKLEDMDFNDVFGGPPRRFSMQEVSARYSFGEAVESEEEKGSSPWSGLTEKPVFGEEIPPRRRRQGCDFFDDIFKGGAEAYSSPRRSDRDRDGVFGSNPGSRIMSPSRPLPPKSDPFATSLPAQLSLPAKLTKAMDLPTFGSHNHGQHKADGSTNGLNSPHSSSPLSRFSNHAVRAQDEIRNEGHTVSRQSPLSYEASFIIEDTPSTVMSDEKDSKKDTRNVDSVGNQFHFSIYKWAGRGVPMLMPLVIENNLKSIDNRKYDKSASSNGRTESKFSTAKKQSSLARELEFLSTEHAKEDLRREEEQVKSLDKSEVRGKIEKEVPVKMTEFLKSELKKPPHAFLDEGNFTEIKDKNTKTPRAHEKKNVKEKEGEGNIDSKNARVGKSSLKVAAKNLEGSQGKSVGKGKVKEFVQIFNQEGDSRPKADSERNRSSRWRNVSSKAAKDEEQVKLHNVEKKTDVSFKVDEILNSDEARQYPPTKTPSYTSDRSTTPRKFSSEMFHSDSRISVENLDDPLEDNFQVQELSDAHENVTQSESSESEDTKAIDAKIRQWSVGKKGNIRSLLSTLQYVLWPESGWKAVALVDLIEANSVKRAYQKALLRLHPDKLQQKDAAFHHKYTAEKVFDILQEAWDHFNTCTITV